MSEKHKSPAEFYKQHKMDSERLRQADVAYFALRGPVESGLASLSDVSRATKRSHAAEAALNEDVQHAREDYEEMKETYQDAAVADAQKAGIDVDFAHDPNRPEFQAQQHEDTEPRQ